MKKNNTESKLKMAAKQQMADPPAFVWNNIEEELQPKESKRRIGFWWIGSGLMAIIAIALFVTIGQNKSDHTSIEPVAELVEKKNNTASAQPLNRKTNTDNSISTNQLNKSQIGESKINLLTATSTQSKNTQSQTEKQRAEQKIESENLSTTHTKNKKTIRKNTVTAINIDHSNSRKREDINNSYNKKVAVNSTPLSQSIESKINNIEQFISLNLASTDLNELVYSRTDILYVDYPKLDKKIKLKPFIEFGLLGGIHNISISEGNNTELYNQRNATESSWYSTGLYTNFGLNISKNWHVSIGTEWTISKDRFASKSEEVTKMIVTFDPASGSALDTNFVSGSFYYKADITFHFIDIPISVGYTVSKEKWEYGAELTGLFNIKTFSEGKIYNENEGITTIEDKANTYKSSVGLGLRSSLLFARKLDNNFTVQVRSSFKTYLNTINTKTYPLPTRYGLFSVSVGVRKEF